MATTLTHLGKLPASVIVFHNLAPLVKVISQTERDQSDPLFWKCGFHSHLQHVSVCGLYVLRGNDNLSCVQRNQKADLEMKADSWRMRCQSWKEDAVRAPF